MQIASLAALAGVLVHYLCFYAMGTPLLPEAIAEWIMARTPSRYALLLLDGLGAWAKPSAVTGGLATLGAVLWLARWRAWLGVAAGGAVSWVLGFWSPLGLASFWLPAAAVLIVSANPRCLDVIGRLLAGLQGNPERSRPERPVVANQRSLEVAARSPQSSGLLTSRRRLVVGAAMATGTVAVAVESFLRERVLAATAARPVPLFRFAYPEERSPFSPPLVRRAVTPIAEFYGMSKNAVDPVIDPEKWRLRITLDGRSTREFGYRELLALPRSERYVTLRCISNTLQSNLMGNALWSGFRLTQIVDRAKVPAEVIEVAVIGVDGHGDSYPLDYAFGEEALLALGMNGETLDRTHGFPIRLLVPRYYGFKHVKWIDEIRFCTQPYLGTWPKMGYTREPAIHTVCYVDRVRKVEGGLEAGGIAFAGSRGIRRVQVRADKGAWVEAERETPLSAYAWTRWRVVIPVMAASTVEARALDGAGRWQSEQETPLFPNGVDGPTVKKVSL